MSDPIDLAIKFANRPQRELFHSQSRKQCISGGFNNGKTYGACLKAITLLLSFPNYRYAIGRQTYQDLKKTTMETFFKILPPRMVESHNNQEGITVLKNGSTVYWLHLDNVDESTLRGLEINSLLVDQAEEIQEKVYLVLLARVGRWDKAQVPGHLLKKYPKWPKNKLTGNYISPSYCTLLCNPADELHFIYRRYHPDSLEREEDTFFVECEWDKNLGSEEAYKDALKNDQEWVEKYVHGKWGRNTAAIHALQADSLLEPSEHLLERIKSRGALYRTLDHGDSAPTCCLWWASVDGVYICYREYYVPNRVVSYHRQAIWDLSRSDSPTDEIYLGNYADPSIFNKTKGTANKVSTISDEYISSESSAPPITWLKADNNEFATRNKINELLQFSDRFVHPITQVRPAPGLYFVKRSVSYPQGCHEAPVQLKSQKRLPLGTLNGKILYSDDRDASVTDHAYDCVRYFVACVGTSPGKVKKAPPRNSFAYYQKVLETYNYPQFVPNSMR